MQFIRRYATRAAPSFPSSKAPFRQPLSGVDNVLCVSSAKGGVGKSTVSANLALALKASGHRVGLLDADLFGPSIPLMMNLRGKAGITEKNKLQPLENYGVKCMSMGFLIDEGAPVVWRGLMVMKGIQQLLWDVDWGSLDYLVIDMPPGTGDVQLSIAQQVKIAGAIIVSTPQDVALADTMKGITLFNKMNVEILGLVQNMSFFQCSSCGNKSHVFGYNGAIKKATALGIPILGEIPLHEDICETSDMGRPIVVSKPDSPLTKEYLKIAGNVLNKVQSSSSS